MYVALKYSGKLLKKILSKNQPLHVNNGGDENIMQDFDMNFMNRIHINNYKENHDKDDTIDITNIHILNSINTQTVEDNKETCILFFNLEEEIQEEPAISSNHQKKGEVESESFLEEIQR